MESEGEGQMNKLSLLLRSMAPEYNSAEVVEYRSRDAPSPLIAGAGPHAHNWYPSRHTQGPCQFLAEVWLSGRTSNLVTNLA
jgi:hypothetical protein